MAKPIDPTVKVLVETAPDDWPVVAGLARAPTAVVDADIATVSGAADKVLHVGADPPYLLHLEFQSGHDSAQLPELLHVRQALLAYRHKLGVRSVAVLLRPEADSPALTGLYQDGFPEEPPTIEFRYRVIRVWQLPVQPLLAGGLGTLPLAPICAVTTAALPGIIQQMAARLSRQPARSQAASLWSATYILLGMRYSEALAAQLLRGVLSMKESVTYQAILREGAALGAAKSEARGKVQEAQRFLRLLAEKAFGPPTPQALKALKRIDDLERLETLGMRVLEARSWQDLLDLTPPRRRPRKDEP